MSEIDSVLPSSICMSDEVPHAYDQEYSVSETSSLCTSNNNDRGNNDSKRTNHHIIKITDKASKTGKRRVSIFETNTSMGSTIINAVTGVPYYSDDMRYRIGSSLEFRLFKVKDVSCISRGKSMLLFYDSPSQYERHLNAPLNISIHEKWNFRQQIKT